MLTARAIAYSEARKEIARAVIVEDDMLLPEVAQKAIFRLAKYLSGESWHSVEIVIDRGDHVKT